MGMTCVGLLAAAAALAGPITPPPGPVVSTHKTLTEVEPRIAINATNTPGDANSLFRITQPGSYYLTGNIAGEAAKSGIEVAASNVTIDLMGFDVRGVVGSLQGIISPSGNSGLVIRNGSVGGWSSGGIIINGNGVFACQNIFASGNTGNGISFDTGQVEGCSAFSNTGIGIRLNQGGTITRCFAKGNGGIGIDAGIIASVVNCTAASNTGNGIQASGNSTVAHCSSQQNGGDGFVLDFATLLTDCVARSNSGNGIDARGGSTVRGCSSDRNSLDGIVAATRSLIVGNTLALNGQSATTPGAGIRLTGSDNVVEGNNSVQNDIGIQADSAGNIIRGNTCSGNTTVSYLLVADNVYGPIIDRRIAATAAVNGHVAASTLGSTDPHANFSY